MYLGPVTHDERLDEEFACEAEALCVEHLAQTQGDSDEEEEVSLFQEVWRDRQWRFIFGMLFLCIGLLSALLVEQHYSKEPHTVVYNGRCYEVDQAPKQKESGIRFKTTDGMVITALFGTYMYAEGHRCSSLHIEASP
jgi:hypothetical protein